MDKPLRIMYSSYEKDLKKYGKFRLEDWNADKEQYMQQFEEYKSNTLTDNNPETTFNIRINLIDFLQPFVNKRKVRSRLFKGDQHEVKVVQLEQIPGPAKLIYRDLDRHVSVYEPIYINSIETAEKDISKSTKRLYKKAKKL